MFSYGNVDTWWLTLSGAKAQLLGNKDAGCSPRHGKHTEIKMLDILFL